MLVVSSSISTGFSNFELHVTLLLLILFGLQFHDIVLTLHPMAALVVRLIIEVSAFIYLYLTLPLLTAPVGPYLLFQMAFFVSLVSWGRVWVILLSSKLYDDRASHIACRLFYFLIFATSAIVCCTLLFTLADILATALGNIAGFWIGVLICITMFSIARKGFAKIFYELEAHEWARLVELFRYIYRGYSIMLGLTILVIDYMFNVTGLLLVMSATIGWFLLTVLRLFVVRRDQVTMS